MKVKTITKQIKRNKAHEDGSKNIYGIEWRVRYDLKNRSKLMFHQDIYKITINVEFHNNYK